MVIIRCSIFLTRVGFLGFGAKMSTKLEISDEIRSFCSGERCSPYTVLFFRFSELSVVVELKSVIESLIFSNKPMSVLEGREICWVVVFRNDT